MGVPTEEILRERHAIDKEHVRSEPVSKRSSAQDDGIIPIRNEEPVHGFPYRTIADVNCYVHLLLLYRLLAVVASDKYMRQ